MLNILKKVKIRNVFNLNKFKAKTQLGTSRGFSLIELIVVVGIVTLISGSVFFSHRTFSSNVALENLAYEIALAVRQAQFFGINVRVADNSGNPTFDTGYGVYFNKTNPTQFILFADINKNNFYDGSSETVEIYTITHGNKIKYLCVDAGCSSPEISTFQELNITFVRPEPDAIIKTANPNICGTGPIQCGLAKIYVSSPGGNIPDKIITVGMTGFISVGS